MHERLLQLIEQWEKDLETAREHAAQAALADASRMKEWHSGRAQAYRQVIDDVAKMLDTPGQP